MCKSSINLARVIYDAYPDADLLGIDPEQDCRSLDTLYSKVTEDTLGDGLFTFIVVESVEGGEGTVDGAIRVLERAREDITAVLQTMMPYASKVRPVELTLRELGSPSPAHNVGVDVLCEHGKLWIRPEGYGDACSADGQGWPVALEVWQGRLRVIVFDDINSEDPHIIDMEKARESNRETR